MGSSMRADCPCCYGASLALTGLPLTSLDVTAFDALHASETGIEDRGTLGAMEFDIGVCTRGLDAVAHRTWP